MIRAITILGSRVKIKVIQICCNHLTRHSTPQATISAALRGRRTKYQIITSTISDNRTRPYPNIYVNLLTYCDVTQPLNIMTYEINACTVVNARLPASSLENAFQ